ncbi:hypothetical protein Celaphus_00016049 [Cervus elaphus hippelaphus]|uniref:Uncharacterized protein n=1 Tax=Cervus elaphus hippelaphus TaxID=46360 RepID=A0A212C2E2_CEREH|nr:hypothetical protein Celaphus_00016049 [Cervus elaphus hippelaphus]
MAMTSYLIHHLSPYLLLYRLNSNLSLSHMNPSTYTLSSHQQKSRGILTSCVKPSHLFYSVRWMSLLFKICSNWIPRSSGTNSMITIHNEFYYQNTTINTHDSQPLTHTSILKKFSITNTNLVYMIYFTTEHKIKHPSTNIRITQGISLTAGLILLVKPKLAPLSTLNQVTPSINLNSLLILPTLSVMTEQ